MAVTRIFVTACEPIQTERTSGRAPRNCSIGRLDVPDEETILNNHTAGWIRQSGWEFAVEYPVSREARTQKHRRLNGRR